jgi:hypothetical protein
MRDWLLAPLRGQAEPPQLYALGFQEMVRVPRSRRSRVQRAAISWDPPQVDLNPQNMIKTAQKNRIEWGEVRQSGFPPGGPFSRAGGTFTRAAVGPN